MARPLQPSPSSLDVFTFLLFAVYLLPFGLGAQGWHVQHGNY